MAYNISQDAWFQFFNADGPQLWVLISVYGCRCVWAALGAIANAGVVYTTARSRSLRGICNFLLATESGLAIVQDGSYSISFLVVCSGAKFIRYEHCFWALVPCALCGEAAQLTMVLTGCDRLCAVLFPLWYKARDKVQCLILVYFLLCCYSVYVFCVYYVDYSNSRNIMVSCSTTEMGQGGMGWLLKADGMVLSATLMAVYGLAWLSVFQLSATSRTLSANGRRLIKPLMLLIALNLFGVFLKTSVNYTLQYLAPVNAFVRHGLAIAFSFLTVVVYSANAPVLYTISTDYRRQFDQHFKWLPKLLGIMGHNVEAQMAAIHHINGPTLRMDAQNNANRRESTPK